ncbi:MAG: AAA family ATPase [Bryobacteraceae bacterium]|nr:AAA family ATPase [Bryobacteraceae bacterium]
MEYKVVYTKLFNRNLRDLAQQGQKKVVQAVRAAISEAGMTGGIASIPRTKHGETRMADVEKYDLSDGHRLVVQLVDGKAKVRAFLFAGSHDESDRWLDSHRNYRWIRSKTDGTLEFVQVTDSEEKQHVPADRIDLESPEDILALPLLRVLTEEEWTRLNLSPPTREFASSVSGNDYEQDAEGILERLNQLAGWDKAGIILDLLAHSQAREWPELHKRISLFCNDATLILPSQVAHAMLSPENSESFVTFDDADDFDNFFEKNSLADWMLFLHPTQKRVTDRDFKGPARLRGVSGSGKTSVLVHRARFLAKKYRLPVLLVTMTESMRKLLDRLADELCGVERSLIFTFTMSSLAKRVVDDLQPQLSSSYTLISQQQQDTLISTVSQHVRENPDFGRTPLHIMENGTLIQFLYDEISYVRGRLLPTELDQYLDTAAFNRRGRGFALNEMARAVVLEAIRFYEEALGRGLHLDHEGIVAEALKLLGSSSRDFNKPRCILCDEVQDLSQLEVALLGQLPTPSGALVAQAENGLFLAGDGAQTIYKRGFTLRRLGIDVSGRSFNLQKNYRNTYEILTAAFHLVSQYEFADVDEENIVKPSAPEFANRHGARPLMVSCSSLGEEAAIVAQMVRGSLNSGEIAGQICVIGPSAKSREEVQRALSNIGIAHTDLRQDADFESDRVKVSTIESAKGHEFGSVFIVGLVDGVLPNAGIAENEIPREAARLYVAMTRARNTLTLSYSPTGGYVASRFLLSIQPHCDEARVKNGQLQKLR